MLSVGLTFLVVVTLAFYLTKWIAKRSIPFTKDKHIKIIEKNSLGVDRSISLIHIGSYFYILGNTKQNMIVIDKIHEKEYDFSEVESIQTFEPFLKKVLNQKENERNKGKIDLFNKYKIKIKKKTLRRKEIIDKDERK